MNRAIQPVTALPWTTNHDNVIYTQNGLSRSGTIRYEYQQDAAYITHACNAYPELVAALREAADNLFYRGGNERAEAYRAILRQLGEDN